MSQLIPLTQGKSARVNASDYPSLSQWRWRLNSKGYAIRSFYVSGKEIVLCMHRVILNAQPGEYVDHISGDRLDNRRVNLRLCTQSENLANRGLFSNSTTGFTGISFQHGKWHACIQKHEQTIHLGFYADLQQAVQVRDCAAALLFGEFARLNVPEQPIPEDVRRLVITYLSKPGLFIALPE